MDKLVLIDGNSIFYRAFYALPLLSSPHGYSNAVYGFANILIKSIETLNPTHVAVAFDVSKHTFRNEIYADYKATRNPMPEELRSQIPTLKEMLSKMNIAYYEKEGIEGDDILGTIAHRYNIPVVIVTGDRDCFQLVDNTTTICRTLKGVTEVKMMDEAVLKEDYGVSPAQIIELKALAGDSSDNIPGVPGIGEKTALTLLQKYDNIDNIYQNINEITGKLKEKLENGRQLAFVSKQLATINCNIDIQTDLNDMVLHFPFDESVHQFFEKYQMRTFLKRNDLWSNNAKEVLQSKQNKCKEFEAKSIDELKEFATECYGEGTCGLFLDYKNSTIQIASPKTNCTYHFHNDLISSDISDVALAIKPLVSSSAVLKVFFDAKQTMHQMAEHNIEIKMPFFDVSIARHLLDGSTVKNFEDIMVDLNLNSKTVAHSLIEASKILDSKMQEQGVKELYQTLELPLIGVLFDMEQTGFSVDTKTFANLKEKYTAEAAELKKQITEMVGEFNLNSPKQLSEILFDKLGLPHNKKKSTGVDELEFVKEFHPVVPLILRYRKVSKFLSNYIDGLQKHIDKNGKIHTVFKQTITGTGRLSSTEPNLQNIPIRSDESREIRSMFVASSPNNVLVDADYSQIELRLLAHMSQEPNLIEAFKKDVDIHTQTAANIFNVPTEMVTSQMRRTAKVVNFGVVYGISDFGLANDLGISPKQAKAYIENFFVQNPKVKEYVAACVATAHETGCIKTILGRIRKIADINSTNYFLRSRAERVAQNAPLQGSGADIIKIAMLKVGEKLKVNHLKAKLIMQVHDELVIDCPKDELEIVQKIAKTEMESAQNLLVPLVVDVSNAYRWSESH